MPEIAYEDMPRPFVSKMFMVVHTSYREFNEVQYADVLGVFSTEEKARAHVKEKIEEYGKMDSFVVTGWNYTRWDDDPPTEEEIEEGADEDLQKESEYDVVPIELDTPATISIVNQ